MRHRGALFLAGTLVVSCLPWDPRPDGGVGSSAGGVGGAGGGGGGVAGGAGGGGQADAGAGDYVLGGCFTSTDGGLRCHPFCRPSPATGRADGEACCLDEECRSGNCVGALGDRTCSSTASQRAVDAPCGDETDCLAGAIGPTFYACDVVTQRCATTLPRPDGRCSVVQALVCDVGGGRPCALPGAVVGRLANSTNPCCYDRCDGGRWCDCLETGACTCVAGQCNTTGRDSYTCPF